MKEIKVGDKVRLKGLKELVKDDNYITYEEFKEEIEKLGFDVTFFGSIIDIYDKESNMIAATSMRDMYWIDTGYFALYELSEYKQKEVFNLCTKFAATPLKEREDEKLCKHLEERETEITMEVEK